jgi:hypothetical protein
MQQQPPKSPPAPRRLRLPQALLAMLAAMALTACDADVPPSSPFSFVSTHHRSFP